MIEAVTRCAFVPTDVGLLDIWLHEHRPDLLVDDEIPAEMRTIPAVLVLGRICQNPEITKRQLNRYIRRQVFWRNV